MWARNNQPHQQWYEDDWVIHSRKDPSYVLDFVTEGKSSK